jgi:hypothetical protein
MASSFSPVQYVYREIIDEETRKGTDGKIFFFDDNDTVDSCEGRVIKMEEFPQQGIFILLDSGKQIRVDRIITLFGKPGAAFDEYDNFANQCLSCTGGYDL